LVNKRPKEISKEENKRYTNSTHKRKCDILKSHFGWQDEYFAVSIGESQFGIVLNYINNQEKHHQKKHSSKNIMNLLENMVLK